MPHAVTTIYCRTLGPLAVTVAGAAAPAELMWRKNVALLLYLARAPARGCTREHAIGLLWPEKDESAARQSLREAVRVVRHVVGETRLETDGDQIHLVEGAVELDVDRLDRLTQQGDWAGAAALVAGEFLEGFSVPDCTGFEDWLLAERGHWRTRAIEALIRHAEARLAAGDLLGADDPARRAMALDPLSDRAVRTLMRRLALAGDRSRALELHARFAERVARECGGSPDAETEALAARLQSGREWRLPAALAAAETVQSRRAPLVGRDRDLARALEWWQESRAGRLALAVIEAPSGGGKTRLVEEIVTRAALDGGLGVAMRAVPADRDQPLSGIVSLARGALLSAPGAAGAHPAALATVARHVGEWAERFPGAQDAEGWHLGSAVIEILRVVAAEQPVVLVFDDAQWLDDGSFAVIEMLARDLARAPLLLLLATTLEPAPPKLAELRARIGRDLPGGTLTLAALDDAMLVTLARWAFPAYSEEQVGRVGRRIAADSAGVPLLAVEICHAVAQGLDLDATSGAWPRALRTLDHTLPGDLPDTIVAAIRVGFRCLSANAQLALAAAAVLGDRVDAGAIGRASGLSGESLHTALDELEWRQWLVAEPRGYALRARIVRQVVARDMVTEGQRRRILEA